jgi:8-oxo-dGTP diphosphatase
VTSKRGCGILFFRKEGPAVLVYRRDAKPQIPFPDHLDIVGGHVEEGETPEQAIVREVAEELHDLRINQPLTLNEFELFTIYEDGQQEHYIFCKEADFEVNDLHLKEGQCLLWLREEDIDTASIAFGFEKVLRDFFHSSYVSSLDPR